VQDGLSEADAAAALAAQGPVAKPASSRSYGSIVRANVLTVFNAILAAFGAITLVFGDWRDALFLGVIVANTTIGIAQEVRAKRTLDRLALLVAPRATVVRDGSAREVAVGEVVRGDLVRVGAGDQVVADGEVRQAHDL
jgi:magnesium-transporting ATPase (P-type)